ncbi:hypothetical protein BGX23_001386, partial [Mortierella sp. AD031]
MDLSDKLSLSLRKRGHDEESLGQRKHKSVTFDTTGLGITSVPSTSDTTVSNMSDTSGPTILDNRLSDQPSRSSAPPLTKAPTLRRKSSCIGSEYFESFHQGETRRDKPHKSHQPTIAIQLPSHHTTTPAMAPCTSPAKRKTES